MPINVIAPNYLGKTFANDSMYFFQCLSPQAWAKPDLSLFKIQSDDDHDQRSSQLKQLSEALKSNAYVMSTGLGQWL